MEVTCSVFYILDISIYLFLGHFHSHFYNCSFLLHKHSSHVVCFSVTSSSVWVNLPISVSLIIFIRYLSFGLDVRKQSVASSKQASVKQPSHKISIGFPKVLCEKSNWRTKVNSPEVEEAIDNLTRHLVSEWIMDLWYSRITPDKDGPEELVQIVNGAIAEISSRARNVNLIHLITRLKVLNFVLCFFKWRKILEYSQLNLHNILSIWMQRYCQSF